MLARLPKREKGQTQAQAPVGVPGFDKPIECGAKVTMSELQLIEPFFTIRGAILCSSFLGYNQRIGGMGAEGDSLFPAGHQFFAGVLAKGFEHWPSAVQRRAAPLAGPGSWRPSRPYRQKRRFRGRFSYCRP